MINESVPSDTTLCDKVCQWLVTGRWFSQGTLVSSTNKTDCHNITEILLKVALTFSIIIDDRPTATSHYISILINRVYHLVWVGFKLTTSVVRGTGCTGPEVKTQKCMHKYYPDMYLILYCMTCFIVLYLIYVIYYATYSKNILKTF
jgi:hypothetical protein